MDTTNRWGAFISYSRSDAAFALDFARELKSAGYPVWLDQLDIATGTRWDDEVERALSECEIFLIILTPASVSSDNVKDEIGYAIDHRKRIMPVLLIECTIPLRLRRFQYVDFTNLEFGQGIERAKQLLETLLNQQDLSALSIPPTAEPQKKLGPAPRPSPLLADNKPIQRSRLGVGSGMLLAAIFIAVMGALIWRGLIPSPDPTGGAISTETNIKTPANSQTNPLPTQIPTVDILNQDWNSFREKVIETIKSLNSYKSSSTGQDVTARGEMLSYEANTEIVIGKLHEVKRYENGDVVELIIEQSDSCFRTNGSQWDCQSGRNSVGDFMAFMISVVEGTPSWNGPIVIDHGSRLETYDGKACRAYFSEELYTGEGYQTNWRYELCFDLVTYFPVHQLTTYKYIENENVTENQTFESRFYDFNVPNEIELPRP